MLSRRQLASRGFAFVMAGGRGERLYPLTEFRAKPLVPVGCNRRLIDFTLSNCFNSGLQRIAVLAQYHSELVHDHVRKVASNMKLRRGFSGVLACLSPARGKVYTGTADAVFQNLHCLDRNPPDFVVILSGDHVYNMDYLDLVRFHVDGGSEVTIAGAECPTRLASHFGVLEAGPGNRVIGFDEKPSQPKTILSKPRRSLVSMGVYVFNTGTLRQALVADAGRNSRHDFGRNIIPELVITGQVSVYNFTEFGSKLSTYWRDVGTIESYFTSNMELLLNGDSGLDYKAKWPSCAPNARAVRVANSHFVSDSIMTSDVSIGPEALISRSLLFRRVRVCRQALIEDSILMQGVRVGRGARIRRAIIDENVTIPGGMQIGYDVVRDRKIGVVTESGIVVIPANTRLGPENEDHSNFLEWPIAAMEASSDELDSEPDSTKVQKTKH